jgi:class I fructose-bisphosphate aldolase
MRWSAPKRQSLDISKIQELLGEEVDSILGFSSPKIAKTSLLVPSSKYVEEAWGESDRNDKVKRNLHRLFNTGRLAHTGYLSILPVDQGIEHAAGFSFVKNPEYFDPARIVELAYEAGCNGVASSVGVLGAVSKKYADKLAFVVKLNHNELLSYPNHHDQTLFAQVKQASEMGAAAVGATIYFGSPESRRQITEISAAFAEAHERGMATILWCYVRNDAFTVDGENSEAAADVTGQANYLGASIQADIIKQKFPESSNGFGKIRSAESAYGKYDESVYSNLLSDNPIDRVRYQLLNNFAGRVGLLNSGGASTGASDLAEAVRLAVINKRAGGMGIIAGRKAFQRSFAEGVEMLNAIQDVYLCREVTVA